MLWQVYVSQAPRLKEEESVQHTTQEAMFMYSSLGTRQVPVLQCVSGVTVSGWQGSDTIHQLGCVAPTSQNKLGEVPALVQCGCTTIDSHSAHERGGRGRGERGNNTELQAETVKWG